MAVHFCDAALMQKLIDYTETLEQHQVFKTSFQNIFAKNVHEM